LNATTIGSAILALGLVIDAVAQPPSRVPTVGVLSPASATERLAALSREAFERGLKERGWIPGQTIHVEFRYAENRLEQLDELARDLVRRGVDVIVARATTSIRAAKQATTSIPIVMSGTGSDPVDLGFVASRARPGGNITGLTLLNRALLVKQLELLKETVPRLSRVAVLGSKASRSSSTGWQNLEAAALALSLQLHHAEMQSPQDLDEAFAGMVRARAGGLIVLPDPFVLEPHIPQVVALALKHRLAAVYWLEAYTRAGGLMSYGTDLLDVHRRSALFVDRILRGAPPADLPVEEPTKFALVVNGKTARALGLKVPQSVVTRANDIIE
jgi:putative ABC transport system substrate-binding protein